MFPGNRQAAVESLPAYGIAGEVNHALARGTRLIVTAPPGAGKSTVLPLTILEAFPEGKILMLEPRRVAARQVAERMAWLLGESVGKPWATVSVSKAKFRPIPALKCLQRAS